MCGMIARRSFQAQTLSPPAAACGRGFQAHAARRRVRACRLTTLMIGGSDRGSLATPVRGVGRRGIAMCGRRPIQKTHEKARGGFLGAGFMISAMSGFALDLPDVSNHFRAVNKLRKMQRN